MPSSSDSQSDRWSSHSLLRVALLSVVLVSVASWSIFRTSLGKDVARGIAITANKGKPEREPGITTIVF